MEFVRLKFANNKLFNANLKEHREVIEEYVMKRGYKYLGFVPVIFGPSGKMMEIDLIFKKPIVSNDKDSKTEPKQAKVQEKK